MASYNNKEWRIDRLQRNMYIATCRKKWESTTCRHVNCVLCFHTGDEARLLNVSAEELKLLMETMAKETLSSYQVTNLREIVCFASAITLHCTLSPAICS